MNIRKFDPEQDLQPLEAYLRDQYRERQDMASWLPQRLHDLIYRMAAQEADGGREKSMDYIFLWEEMGEIIACILPDGENVYFSIRSGFEHLFPSLLDFSETHCLPLFTKSPNGSVKFWVAVCDSLGYMTDLLQESGYTRYAEEDYNNFVNPLEMNVSVDLPDGFRLLYGDAYPDEENKWGALHLGFHPEHEIPDYQNNMHPYQARKDSSLYPDSFECLIIDENSLEQNNVCAYCFVYVDKQTRTALIEPVSTRQRYQRRGLGTAMMHGVMLRCKEMGIEKCYVNSFGWRRKFYNAAGFITEDVISFWHKRIGSCA